MGESRYENPSNSELQAFASDPYAYKYVWDPVSVPQAPAKFQSVRGTGHDLPPLWAQLSNRINNAAGPYEMVGGSLVDAIVYACNVNSSWYIEDLPEDLVHE